jgi:glucokinase
VTTLEPLADVTRRRGRDGPGAPDGLVVGVDIGGTKTAILVCDRDGAPLVRHVAPTAIGAPGRAAESIAALIERSLAEAGADIDDVAAVGVGVPGRVDTERGEVSLAVNLDWHDLPLGPRLEARLGVPIVLENDVRAAALGLHRRRVLGQATSLGLLAIGTGISAGVVIGDELHRGARGLAGEIGHAILDPAGPRCACGNRGCFEAIAAGPAIARRANDAWAAAGRAPVPAEAVGRPGAESVFEAAAAGDEIAVQVIEAMGRAIAWGVHLLAVAYDLEHIVIGGGVSHAGEPFMTPIRREVERLRDASPLARELLAPDVVKLLPPGADAGAWGAVTVARETLAKGLAAPADRGREVGHA